MRILLVNAQGFYDGGAGRAAHRLNRALLKTGIESQILVQDSQKGNKIIKKSIYLKYISKIQNKIDNVPVKIYKRRSNTRFSVAWNPFNNFVEKINRLNPDIVHLHWICRGMIRIEDLYKIKVPIVWSLHDMWAFTGGCHYNETCCRYKANCGKCKVLKSERQNDLSRKIYERKKCVYNKMSNITIVALSEWMKNCAKESSLLKNKTVLKIPNPIDVEIFKPYDKIKSRELWKIPKNKKIILFGSMGAIDDPRKGFKNLKNAISKIQKKNNIEIIVFGSDKHKSEKIENLNISYIGYIKNDEELMTLYNAADVFVLPTEQDNLPNTIMEALSCGIPCVSFNVGGIADMVHHKKNGYLARPFDSDDLAYGIEWVMNIKEYEMLSLNSRQVVKEMFEERVVAKKYVELYEDIMRYN